MLLGTLILFIFPLTVMYWFRYTRLLILRTRTTHDYSRAVAEANGLTFLESSRQLQSDARETLDEIQRALHRDYELLCGLLRHSTGFGNGESGFHQFILRLDYTVLRSVYPLVRVASGQMARHALLEMAGVVSYLAHSMGERAVVRA